jgi:hypothetical protein
LVKTVLSDMQESDVIYFKSLWFMLQRQHDAKHKLAKIGEDQQRQQWFGIHTLSFTMYGWKNSNDYNSKSI